MGRLGSGGSSSSCVAEAANIVPIKQQPQLPKYFDPFMRQLKKPLVKDRDSNGVQVLFLGREEGDEHEPSDSGPPNHSALQQVKAVIRYPGKVKEIPVERSTYVPPKEVCYDPCVPVFGFSTTEDALRRVYHPLSACEVTKAGATLFVREQQQQG